MKITREIVNATLKELVEKYPDCNYTGLTPLSYDLASPLAVYIDDDEFLDQVSFCYEYILKSVAVSGVHKTITEERENSYGLKHAVECYIRKHHKGKRAYVANLAFIVAMELHPEVQFELIGEFSHPFTNLCYDQKSIDLIKNPLTQSQNNSYLSNA